jgi:hypothetical protein
MRLLWSDEGAVAGVATQNSSSERNVQQRFAGDQQIIAFGGRSRRVV